MTEKKKCIPPRRKVTGQSPSSRADARDLREISPCGRNDNDSDLCAFATDFLLIGWRKK